MSLTSQIGAFGIAEQVAKTTTNTTTADFTWFPTLRIPQFAQRNADELPKEISGQRGSNGSYVVNVSVDGVIEALGRGRSMIPLFKSLMGTGDHTDAAGVETWTFTVTEDYQWLTSWKKVGDFYAERFTDTLVDALTMTVNNGQPARFAWDMLGCNTITTEIPDDEDMVWDRINPVQAVGPLSTVSFGGELDMPVRNAEIRLGNGSSRDEFVIGSYYRHDITKLDLILEMSAEVVVSSVDLYNTVIYGTANPPAGSQMSPALTEVEGFYVEVMGAEHLGSTDVHNKVKVEFAEVQVVTFPFELVGNNLLVANVMVRGHLQSDMSSPATITLVCPAAA